MVKDHSVIQLIHHPTYMIAHTTAFIIPVVEQCMENAIAQLVHHDESIRRLIAPWANTVPRSYTPKNLWSEAPDDFSLIQKMRTLRKIKH